MERLPPSHRRYWRRKLRRPHGLLDLAIAVRVVNMMMRACGNSPRIAMRMSVPLAPVDIVVHNYRWRLGLAKEEPQYDALEQKLFAGPVITVPAITISSGFDGPAKDGKAYANKFSGRYSHRILNGIGHNVPQEAPQAFAQAGQRLRPLLTGVS
jgi:pimeloyl-ACP methyl ester carboxylesterase